MRVTKKSVLVLPEDILKSPYQGHGGQPLRITFITLHHVITFQKVQTALFEFEAVARTSARSGQEVNEIRRISRTSMSCMLQNAYQ